MILETLHLQSRANKTWEYSGIDSYTNCLNKEHFNQYPHKISYDYSSRGFRDNEWPDDDELQDCIWCFGDSFTVGVGSPLEHTWVYLLQQRTGKRCINVSMDGASNKWILDRVVDVIDEVNPPNIVIHWSYLHRWQAPDSEKNLSNEDRRQFSTGDRLISDTALVTNFIDNVLNKLEHYENNIVYSCIPGFTSNLTTIQSNWNNIAGESWPKIATLEDIDLITDNVKYELETMFSDDYKNILDIRDSVIMLEQYISKNDLHLIHVDRIDLARDGHHYDIKTANNFVDKIIEKL